MASKIDILDRIGLTKSLCDKCDPLAVKRLVMHMVTIDDSFEYEKISEDDRRELRTLVRNMSEKFSNDCRCIKV